MKRDKSCLFFYLVMFLIQPLKVTHNFKTEVFCLMHIIKVKVQANNFSEIILEFWGNFDRSTIDVTWNWLSSNCNKMALQESFYSFYNKNCLSIIISNDLVWIHSLYLRCFPYFTRIPFTFFTFIHVSSKPGEPITLAFVRIYSTCRFAVRRMEALEWDLHLQGPKSREKVFELPCVCKTMAPNPNLVHIEDPVALELPPLRPKMWKQVMKAQ